MRKQSQINDGCRGPLPPLPPPHQLYSGAHVFIFVGAFHSFETPPSDFFGAVPFSRLSNFNIISCCQFNSNRSSVRFRSSLGINVGEMWGDCIFKNSRHLGILTRAYLLAEYFLPDIERSRAGGGTDLQFA